MSSHRASLSGNVLKIAGYEHQPDATLSQAAPVQNTWYTILDTTKNVRLYAISIAVATTGEDLELRLTIDNQIIYFTGAAIAATNYIPRFYPHLAMIAPASAGDFATSDSIRFESFASNLEAKTAKVEVRKTSAAGAGTLSGRVKYAKIP